MATALSINPIPHIFLGRGDNRSLLINVVHPTRVDITSLSCDVYTAEGKVHTEKATFRDEIVRLYSFKFRALTHATTYRYRIYTNDGVDLDLGEGLAQDDLQFTYWAHLDGPGDAILMSCNGVYAYKGKEKNRFRPWDMAQNAAEKRGTKLTILGGDQYYQDDVEAAWISKLNDEFFKKNYADFKTASLANALTYMCHPSYRKLMASVPSVAMLDDHDITDGAGGRSKFFVGQEFTTEWKNYASVQKEIFELLQASRNPTPVLVKKDSAFSFILDLGESALVAFDMRTEKNSEKKLLMERDSQDSLFAAIKALPHKNVFILLPVVPLRNSAKFEKIENFVIACATLVARTNLFNWSPKIKHAIEYVADCSDDLNDGLNSECNVEFLSDLFKVMAYGADKGVNYAFFSGDIHTGGVVDLRIEYNKVRFSVPLLISSPIGYEPMPELAEAALREKKQIDFEHSGVKVLGVTGRFSTLRNFMTIQLNRLFTDPNKAAIIYEERIGPRAVLVKDWLVDELDTEVSKKTEPVKKNNPEASV